MVYIDYNEEGKSTLIKFNDDEKINLLPMILKQVEVIGEEAFAEYNSLVSIYIPDNVKQIKKGAFRECSRLAQVRLPSGLECIEDEVFMGCTSLPCVELPTTVKTIGNNSFKGCSHLSEINLPKRMRLIGVAGFNMCSNLREIDLPGNVEIGSCAFMESGLTSVIVPRDVKLNGEYIFSDTKLCEAFVLGGKTLPYGTFNNCTLLEQVELPEGLETIQAWAFSGCTYLNRIQLPESVHNICTRAFENSAISTINFPEKLKMIGSKAFAGCKYLSEANLVNDDVNVYPEAFDSSVRINYSKPNKRIFNYLIDKIESNQDLKEKDKRHMTSLIKYILDEHIDTSSNISSSNAEKKDIIVNSDGILEECDIKEVEQNETDEQNKNIQQTETVEQDKSETIPGEDELMKKLRFIVEQYKNNNDNNNTQGL